MSAERLARLNTMSAQRMRDGEREAARLPRTLEAQGQLVAHLRRAEPVTTEFERAAVAAYEPLGATYPCAVCSRFAFSIQGVTCWWCRHAVIETGECNQNPPVPAGDGSLELWGSR